MLNLVATRKDPQGLQDNTTTSVAANSSGLPTPTELSDVVLQAIVANKGVRTAAAAWLKSHYDLDIAPHELVDHLNGRLPELKEKMELVATLDLFSLMPQLQQALTSQIGDLDPTSASRAYMDLMKLIQQSTSKNELNINVHEEIWHRAPRDLQRLFAQLEAAGQLSVLDTIIDHDPDND